ncbi:MAG: hypothetical protein IKX67_09865 [Bacteroidales bacterium]|nr:hypothetical protein [Bacteroidales bacterium]
MKRFITIAAIVLLGSISASAQFTYLGKANQHTIFGGEDGKNYAAIFATDCSSRQEAIKKTVGFLTKYKLVQNEEAALAAVKEYDDSQSEFTIPVSFRFGWHGTAPTMGAVASLAPVILNADLLFQFYDTGKVRMIIKNLQDMAYMYYLYYTKSQMSSHNISDYLTEEECQEYDTYSITPTMQDGLGKGIMKFLVFANMGSDKIDDFFAELDKYYHDIDRQVYLAQKLADGGFFIFGTPEDIVKAYRELAAKDDYRMAVQTLDNIEKEIAEGRLVSVYELFWRRDIKRQLDNVIMVVNQYLEGKVEAIAEDGDVVWELSNGKLLPVDAKLRKKLEKSGQDYFTYYDL